MMQDENRAQWQRNGGVPLYVPREANACASCGMPMESNAAFCSYCGASIAQRQHPNACPYCGSELIPNARFCVDCGKSLIEQTAAKHHSKKWVPILLAGLGALTICIVAVVVALLPKGGDTQETELAAPQQDADWETTQEPTHLSEEEKERRKAKFQNAADAYDQVMDILSGQGESKETTEEKSVCITELERTGFDRYTGNEGDSRLNVLGERYEYGNGNRGVNGEIFYSGFEAWIARWNYTPEKSWVSATYNLNAEYNIFSGSTGLIESYNTSEFQTAVCIYGDGELLYWQLLTAEEYAFDFEIDVTNVNSLEIRLKDFEEAYGGTSIALYHLFLKAN